MWSTKDDEHKILCSSSFFADIRNGCLDRPSRGEGTSLFFERKKLLHLPENLCILTLSGGE